jgi:uncharacterized protein (TIGR03083 family)
MTITPVDWPRELGVLDARPLFRPLHRELIGLLESLNPADWERETLAGDWKVKDVAAHLLDGGLRRIAAGRDRHLPPPPVPIHTPQDLARFINDLNRVGTAFGRRLSPRVLTDLLRVTGEWAAEHFESLPLHERALWPVSWAGEAESENWMDIARDYTEHWHHQMQIRDAVGAARLLEPRWMEPLLDVSVRALPVAYANLGSPEGTAVTLEVVGPTSGAWSVFREGDRWRVAGGRPGRPDAVVRLAADDVWRVLFNAVRSPGLSQRIVVEGNPELARPLLDARSVVV